MMVAFDTNVIVSGLYSRKGASFQLLRAALSGELAYAVSPMLALEYEGKIDQKIREGLLRISKTDAGRFLDAMVGGAVFVWEPVRMTPVLPDLADLKVLEYALSCEATHIVTFNIRHFPEAVISPYGIEAVTAPAFLEKWRVSR